MEDKNVYNSHFIKLRASRPFAFLAAMNIYRRWIQGRHPVDMRYEMYYILVLEEKNEYRG
jgi:hypothetical protein